MGYIGYSRSERAAEAESEGKLPLTRAIAEVAKQGNITRKAARIALESIGPCEWHHTSKHFNETNYYSVSAALNYIRLAPVRDWLSAHPGWDSEIATITLDMDTQTRKAIFARAYTQVSTESGFNIEDITNAYYGIYD